MVQSSKMFLTNLIYQREQVSTSNTNIYRKDNCGSKRNIITKLNENFLIIWIVSKPHFPIKTEVYLVEQFRQDAKCCLSCTSQSPVRFGCSCYDTVAGTRINVYSRPLSTPFSWHLHDLGVTFSTKNGLK